MPIITIDAGKMEKKQKETLIEGFTKTASTTLNIPEQAFVVLIKENDPDNVGTGGVMLSKKQAD
ncbi:tautomerase family protein [Metallumcola ferriviriculae]|uniref:Tautomerase family protein n=1 Tax=Metallumcola ferriviriculae TaxID=3039180 RepID=A0AAU0UT54_9FIRM|nr:tautomerase family protein [Desulfitibacteraceae bacterium MK1]